MLSAAGYNVEKEYYLNDAGSQIDAFYQSLYARYMQCLGTDIDMPAGGYMGDYMIDLAAQKAIEQGAAFEVVHDNEQFEKAGAIGAFLRY